MMNNLKKHPFVQSLVSGLTLGAVVGVGLYLFNSPAEFTMKEHLMSLLAAAIMALISGVFLGCVFYLIEYLRAKRFDAYRQELKVHGELVLEERASRLILDKACSGRLFLTDRLLVFRPSRDGDEECVLSLSDIATVQITDPRRCHLTVTMNSELRETFVVIDPREWFDLLGKEEPDR